MDDAVFFDEMNTDGFQVRKPYENYNDWLSKQTAKELSRKNRQAEELFRLAGITFNVYGRSEAKERLIPFDIIPRIISGSEWNRLCRGLRQRVSAINAFLYDIYHSQEIIKAGRIPRQMVSNNKAFLPQMLRHTPPGSIYTHISGIDLVRTGKDDFYVLEDNVKTPSGVSYMLENRETMLHMFPELFTKNKVQPVENYPSDLLRTLISSAPDGSDGTPTVAVLTPGIYNSAYYEHAFLADQMGVELAEASDLSVVDGNVALRTIRGYKKIDVLYRRVDDAYLDPLNFKPDSQLGLPGLFDIYKSGRITIANAPGTGIADDKSIYSFMPEIIEFYTGEPMLLKNVPTWRCSDTDSLHYVLSNLSKLVVKEVHGSGGYGMLVGPAASKKELAQFEVKLRAKPDNYIAQPTLSLSTVPTLAKSGLAPRHVDLRPFVLMAPDKIKITSGGLTRVALKKGSLVVNSSQGGGTKDTWVLEE